MERECWRVAYWDWEMVCEVSGERRSVINIGGGRREEVVVVVDGGGFRWRKVVVVGGGGEKVIIREV